MGDANLSFTEMDIPWVESPFFSTLLPRFAKTREQTEAARLFHDQGYLILPDLIPETVCDRIIGETKSLYTDQDDGPRSYYRCQDGWKESPSVRELACNRTISDWLSFLYGRRSFPFQTLNFKFGSQQRAHADVIHFSSMPTRYMCGVWVALEDTGPENGPLFYYPGSNRLPEYNLYHLGMGMHARNYTRYEDFIESLMQTEGFARQQLFAKKGTALIWAANLVHGGSPVLKPEQSRWSQVTHYYFDNCVYYTPFYSNMVTGELAIRSPYNIGTGAVVPSTFPANQSGPAPRRSPEAEELERELQAVYASRAFRVANYVSQRVKRGRNAASKLVNGVQRLIQDRAH